MSGPCQLLRVTNSNNENAKVQKTSCFQIWRAIKRTKTKTLWAALIFCLGLIYTITDRQLLVSIIRTCDVSVVSMISAAVALISILKVFDYFFLNALGKKSCFLHSLQVSPSFLLVYPWKLWQPRVCFIRVELINDAVDCTVLIYGQFGIVMVILKTLGKKKKLPS